MIFDNKKKKYVEEGLYEVCRRLKDLDGSIYYNGFQEGAYHPNKYTITKIIDLYRHGFDIDTLKVVLDAEKEHGFEYQSQSPKYKVYKFWRSLSE